MAIAQQRGGKVAAERFEIRKISRDDLRESLAQGWEDFLEHRGDLIFIGVL